MKSKQHWVFRVFKGLLNLSAVLIEIVFAIAGDKPQKPRYTAIHAQELYDEDLISDAEYVRCVYRK
jgi:hypothetical protein